MHRESGAKTAVAPTVPIVCLFFLWGVANNLSFATGKAAPIRVLVPLVCFAVVSAFGLTDRATARDTNLAAVAKT